MKAFVSLFCLSFIGIWGCSSAQSPKKTPSQPSPNVFINDEMQQRVEQQHKAVEEEFGHFEAYRRQDNSDIFSPYYEKARRVKNMGDRLNEKIVLMKTEIAAMAENISVDEAKQKRITLRSPNLLDNFETPTRYFATQDSVSARTGKAADFKKDLGIFRDSLLSSYFLEQPGDTSHIKLNLETNDPIDYKSGKPVSWEQFYFYHLPCPAVDSELSKWQVNVLDAEASMLRYLLDAYLAKKKEGTK